MTSKAIAIFPTMIYTNNFDPKISDKLLPFLSPYDFSSADGIQGEFLGLADMHLDDNLLDFYKMIVNEAGIYIDTLGINNKLFDLYIVKSTLSKISIPEHHFAAHKHFCSDISFVYYVQVPPGSDSLYFLNEFKPNELFGHMFDDVRERNMLTQYNAFNATAHYINPESGLLVMFPGKLLHGTRKMSPEPFTGDRIAIVGDINLVLKPDQNNWETGKVDLSRWRKFI